MSEKIVIQFDGIEELNVLAGTLGQLPYGQVFQLLDKIGQQAGPQIKRIEEEKALAKVEEIKANEKAANEVTE